MSGNDNVAIVITIRELIGVFAAWTGIIIGILLWLQKQFRDTRHTLGGSMDMRFKILDEKIDHEIDKQEKKADKNYTLLDKRVKDIELRNARQNGA